MVTIIQGDCREKLETIESESVHCCVTSPPYYGLRDYNINGQIGLEETPEQYVNNLVSALGEVRRVLYDDGTLWLNLGDSYAGSNKGMGADGKSYASGKQATNVGSIGLPILRSKRVERGEQSGRWGGGDKFIDGLEPKNLIGIPWRVAFALQGDGWYLRSDIIWHKPNAMCESVGDRPTKTHEYIFLLAKSPKYYYDAISIMEKAAYDGRKDTKMKGSDKYADGFVPRQSAQTMQARGHERWQWKGDKAYRNKRTVWTVSTKPFKGSHFATYPSELIAPCILAGCPEGGTVLDPFAGSGTTGEVCEKLGRNSILIELNPQYI